ncbi:MAG: LysR family transcriptional regulator [Alphaproteobacteria bacterium]
MASMDLNDYVFFAEVVNHGGFAAAGRALGQPKSKLSRRVAQLEGRLGVRLIERSTRRFRVTEVGQALHERCRRIMAELEQAETLAAEAAVEPRGRVRFSCPTGLVEPVSRKLDDFIARYPKVQLQMVATNRTVDLIEERIDVALRVRMTLDSDAALTMRTLTRSRWILVAGPKLANQLAGRGIDALADMPTCAATDQPGLVEWRLSGPGGAHHDLRHEPHFACSDFTALRRLAAANMGVALLPDHACAPDLESGRLVRVMTDWATEPGIVHLVFTTRRGLPPAVRAFIDHLAAQFRDLI